MRTLGVGLISKLVFAIWMLNIAATSKSKKEEIFNSICEVSPSPKLINYYFSDDQLKEFLEWICRTTDTISDNIDEINVTVELIKKSREGLSEPVRLVGDLFVSIFATITKKDLEFYSKLSRLVLVKLINTPDIIEEMMSSGKE
ncbi:uncharacterized protein Eint_010800 [Encephalitozoon intestinalis ATCC 50506]|uniref:Uncharacterized protein n=1 Tax=Encephalitozoon intestinalis (strain ATCC 50506) TaxID=876142 RepID=E0S5F7_ENCIT|nr:uncharacterized protein Eint_010800 [Encephalitozoon intestinalis ATCC 50506]ADM10942.1 hypothetical protein Eint_010800 [Encephalitozoon intestinalis ATCC 50506]UTX44577.1 hypothetical protein GPK93_01g00870 [Encephalitozoon intestinalis]